MMKATLLLTALALALFLSASPLLAQPQGNAKGSTRKGSKLELRIVANVAGSTKKPVIEDPVKWKKDLSENGPLAGRARGDEHQWFEVDPDSLRGSLEKATYQGRTYILLCGKSPYVMTTGWKLTDVRLVEHSGKLAIGFTLDEAGSRALARITKANVGNRMAILVDDKVFSIPTIRGQIGGRGVIAGNFTDKEARDLVEALRIGMVRPGNKDAKP